MGKIVDTSGRVIQQGGTSVLNRETGQFQTGYKPGDKIGIMSQLEIAVAIRSLDRDRINAALAPFWNTVIDAEILDPKNDRAYWAMVHRIRIGLSTATAQEKSQSEEWLRANGMESVLSKP